MRLFQTAAAILLLAGGMLAQSSVQCASFPCSISVTAAQCPSGLPCALTITVPQAAPKFTIGNKISVKNAATVAVTQSPSLNGGLLGTQPYGRTGMVVAGPITDATGDKKTRWQIDYAIGVDGWSVQDYLEKTAVQPPVCQSPEVVANNVCICPSPNVLVAGVCTVPVPAASMSITPPSIDFGAPAVGSVSSTKFFTVTNTGGVALTIGAQTGVLDDSAGNVTGFSYGGTGTCNSTIAVGAKCTISVKYRPASLGAVVGTFTMATNAANSPQSGAMTAGAVQVSKSVVLNWNASAPVGTVCNSASPPVCNTAAVSYNLYRATNGGTLAKIGNVVGSVLTFTDTPVPSGTYNYVATAVDSTGKESVNSNLVTVSIP